MPKKRVYEIAKELNIDNKTILEELSKQGISVKSHSSSLDESDAERIIKSLSTGSKPEATIGTAPQKPAEQTVRQEERGDRQPKPLGLDDRPLRLRPEAGNAGGSPAAQGDRPPRPVGPDGRPLRPRPIGQDGRPLGPDGRPLRPRPVGPDGRPLRPRPEGGSSGAFSAGQGDRPLRPRPEGGNAGVFPARQGDRPPRPLGPDGRPLRPRPENASTGTFSAGQGGRPLRPRTETENTGGSSIGQGDRLPRQFGQDGRPPRPRPESASPTGQGDRPQRQFGQDGRPPSPRPEGASPTVQGDRPQRQFGQDGRPPRPRPEGASPTVQGDRPPRPEGQPYRDGQQGSGRPSGSNYRPQGQQGSGGGYRPQGQQGFGGRPQGQQGFGSRPQGQQGPGGRPSFGQRPPQGRGGFHDKDRDDRPAQRPAIRTDKPGTPKTPLDKPDKHERQQKIEASRKVNRQDRAVDKRSEKLTNKPAAVKQQKPSAPPAPPVEPKVISIPASLTLKELAEAMNKAGAALVKFLMKKGQMIGINEAVDFNTAAEIALEFNILAEEKIEVDILQEVFGEEPEDESLKIKRPPVVVVMGHVDHGKTSLLDAIRHTSVINKEAGGITQHIGAYTVSINDKPITFLDTPGHEAFTAMRMRGAQVTDIAVLVVAADDGVMPQTIEAISHAKAAGIEIIVAINKMDKPSANPDRVKQELTEHGLVAEEWGGETICVPVSAATKTGIDTLLEMIILVSEMKDYKANPNKRARGTVIEASLEKGRGSVATILVQDGTLNIGDSVVAGTTYGKVRAMMDDKGRHLKKAGPSVPVEILGLNEAPQAGDLFHVAINDKQARHVAQNILAKGRVELIKETPQKVSLEDLFTQIKAGQIKDLNIIVKADVQGSVEAVKNSLEKLSNDEVRVRIILGGVGAVTESDVMLAAASNAIIIGFNVRPEAMAKSVAEENSVDIRMYRVIYNAIDDIQAAMKGMLDPVYEESVLGHAEIRQIFKASGVGTIGGSYVTDGKITRNAKVRIVRDGVVIYEGTLEALKRFKDDVKEVNSGYECGLTFTKFNDLKEGDKVEAYIMQEIKR